MRCPGCGWADCPQPGLECGRECTCAMTEASMWSCEVHGLQEQERTPVQIVPATEVERIVGQQRWHFQHVGTWDGATVTILHSQRCRETTPDLRECVFSQALSNGVHHWGDWPIDRPVLLEVKHGLLAQGLWLRRTYVPTLKVS